MMDLFGEDALFEEFEGTEEAVVGNDPEHWEQSDGDTNAHSEEYQELLTKYNCLKESLRHFTSPANIKVKDPTRDGPIAHVTLFNHAISRNCHAEINDFFTKLCQRQVKSDDKKDLSDMQPTFIQYPEQGKETRRKKTSKHAEAKTKAFQAFASVHLYENFCLDQIGEPFNRRDYKLSCPNPTQYEPSRFDPLAGDNELAKPVRKKIQRICFNCGESDHQIKDCDKQRDFKAINERRKTFMDEVAKISGGAPQNRIDGGRYHKDDDNVYDKEKFAEFKPGVVSTELQEALGMGEDDFPPYIYRMRLVGYPPGHLLNAQIIDSGLSLFEEGELDGGGRPNGYIPVDVDKIVSFPGFNTPPLPGQVDKFELFRVPPMNQDHCKEHMVSYFEKRNSLHNKQKVVDNEESNSQDNGNFRDADTMEIDMDTEHTVEESENAGHSSQMPLEIKTHVEHDDAGVEMKIYDGDVGNLTEDELEVKREMLLKQLKQQESSSQDSDYRDIIGKDQDYRKFEEVITISDSGDDVISSSSPILIEDDNAVEMSPIKDSPDSPPPEITESDDPHVNTASQQDTELTTATNSLECTDVGGLKVERNSSSDTDYRLPQPFEPTNTVQTPSINEQETIVAKESPNVVDDDDEKRLPNREKFAEGISQFDQYYQETKPRGTYLKLKELLKDSPRRQEK